MGRDVVIVGGGPAGSSLAIRLAQSGINVSLIEREEFPREKLCGEFISPECFGHFEELDLDEELFGAGGAPIEETVFFSRGGKSIVVPSHWLDAARPALGLSRTAMDLLLLNKAREVGVEVNTSTSATSLEMDGACVSAMTVKDRAGESRAIMGSIYVDATGRSAVLGKLVSRGSREPRASEFVAFKAHLAGVEGDAKRCELYSFDRGYGGLNFVEGENANFCFILRSEEARRLKNSDEGLFRSLIRQNRRASEQLRAARPLHEWLAVAIDRFGTKNLRPASNVFSVGDAGAFIDPFTGSGMLMAFESSKFFAKAFVDKFPDTDGIHFDYRQKHEREFADRLGVSRLVRHAAYRPRVASILISLLASSKASRRLLARATRPRPAKRT